MEQARIELLRIMSRPFAHLSIYRHHDRAWTDTEQYVHDASTPGLTASDRHRGASFKEVHRGLG